MGANKVVVNGETILDLTGDNVSPQTLLQGATAHDAAGNTIAGTVDLSGKQDVLITSGAKSGDLVKVKAVDANGKPTAWEIAKAGEDYADGSHTHDYLPLSGGKLTGNLTGQYITGTWLQTTSASDLGATPGKVAVLDGSGWVYYRTIEEFLSDLGIPAATSIRASTSAYGTTKLSDSVTSSSKVLAATPYAVKTALAKAKEYVDEAITAAINSAY